MPAPKKHTQFIFDDLEDPHKSDRYGYLGLVYEVFKRLAEIRVQKKLSQHDLAQKSGIAQPTIARIEAGRANPTLMQLVKIAKGLRHRISFEPAEFSDGDYEGYLE